jgi:hypothetical protein
LRKKIITHKFPPSLHPPPLHKLPMKKRRIIIKDPPSSGKFRDGLVGCVESDLISKLSKPDHAVAAPGSGVSLVFHHINSWGQFPFATESQLIWTVYRIYRSAGIRNRHRFAGSGPGTTFNASQSGSDFCHRETVKFLLSST